MRTIAYSPDHPLHQFDLYSVHNTNAPLICFIHGGAWRSEDKSDHAELAQSLATATNCAIAVPNYRLTPKDEALPAFRHPGHAEDILRFLLFVLEWGSKSPTRTFDPNRILLIGHSCSAHILASIFLDSSKTSPTLTPSAELLQSVKGIALSEGIYDLDLLISTFPDYRDWFIQSAFAAAEDYSPFSVLTFPLWPSSRISWFVIHSMGDTLVDPPQSEKMYQHLSSIYPQGATYDFHTLNGGHNDILRGTDYVGLIATFAKGILG